MSIFSEYRVGALSDIEFHNACMRMNREERDYVDEWEQYADDLTIDLDSEDENETERMYRHEYSTSSFKNSNHNG